MPATSGELREANLARALRTLHLREGELTRARLAHELRVTRATAGALAAELAELGLVVEIAASPTGRRGRPTTRLVPAAGAPVVAALEIAVDAVRTAVVGLGGRLDLTASASLDRHDVGHVLDVARGQLHDCLAALGRRCAGVGVAVYGLVEHGSGRVVLAPNLGWRNIELRAPLDLPTGLPVRIDNVARLAALAEARRGQARGHGSVLYLQAAVGLGGAVLLDGQPVRGSNGFAGELGHLPLGHDDRPCRCGARGCWETEVDQLALARAADRDATPAQAATVAAAVLADAAGNDPGARRALERTAVVFGRGLGALVNANDPDRIVLGGYLRDLYRAAPALIGRAMAEAAMHSHRGRLPPVTPSTLAADGGLLGAAEALFDDALGQPTVLATHTATARRTT
jgi:predicted NBD/HSP70 family sugar kinase